MPIVRAFKIAAGRYWVDKLDALVLDAVEHRVLETQHLHHLLAELLDHSHASNDKRRQDMTLLRAEKTSTEGAINRLYELIGQGLTSPVGKCFAEPMTRQRQRLAALTADIVLLERQLSREERRIIMGTIIRFGALIRTKLRAGDPGLRQAYMRLLIDEVSVADHQIRITGSKKALEHAVLNAGGDSREGAQLCTKMVHLDSATSNTLFQTLAEWNTYLEHGPARDRAGPPCP